MTSEGGAFLQVRMRLAFYPCRSENEHLSLCQSCDVFKSYNTALQADIGCLYYKHPHLQNPYSPLEACIYVYAYSVYMCVYIYIYVRVHLPLTWNLTDLFRVNIPEPSHFR